MKICVVGNVLKDVYLNLNTSTEHFETDGQGVKWLDFAFDASHHHFFNRNSSFAGAAISLEVLGKMGLEASVIGSDLAFEDGSIVSSTPPATYRYIMIADGAVSYLVPDEQVVTTFVAPEEPVDWLFVDRSACLKPDVVSAITAYLDISTNTRLALYLPAGTAAAASADSANLSHAVAAALLQLAERAELVFSEDQDISVATENLVLLSEAEIRWQDATVPLSLDRIDMQTHLSIYSVAAATVFATYLLERTPADCLKLAKANVENSRLNATLPLDQLESIIASEAESTSTRNSELELIAANLMFAGKGILAADESGGSIKKKFAQLAIPDTYDNRRDYRNLFFTTPNLEKYVNGVILFDETTRQLADNGQNFVDFLTARQIIPGIKVDQGLKPLSDTLETYTAGLSGLRERLTEYYNRGLRFAKWRAAFEIRTSTSGAILTPTDTAITENARILAEYASACQATGLVPIVEPEVVYDGYFSIAQNAEVTGRILDALFAALAAHEVNLRACILKVNMVLAGKRFPAASTAAEIGAATADTLRAHVPAELAGVVFLSGGQTPKQATENLAAICAAGPFPWHVTFSFARALQDPALYAWRGDNANADAARTAFAERLAANCAALSSVNF